MGEHKSRDPPPGTGHPLRVEGAWEEGSHVQLMVLRAVSVSGAGALKGSSRLGSL